MYNVHGIVNSTFNSYNLNKTMTLTVQQYKTSNISTSHGIYFIKIGHKVSIVVIFFLKIQVLVEMIIHFLVGTIFCPMTVHVYEIL